MATAGSSGSPGDVPVPAGPVGAKQLERLRKARFGDGAGAVRVDADPRTGEATLVYVDGAGKEVGREPAPAAERPPPGPLSSASVRPPGPAPPVPAPESPPAAEAEAEPRGRRR